VSNKCCSIIDTEFVGLVKVLSFRFDELTVAKSELVKHLCFFNDRRAILSNFALFIIANVLLEWVCCMTVQTRPLRKKGGIHMLVGLAPYSQTLGS
jgi:hypothetical protein